MCCCKFCNSKSLVKYGFFQGKQKYKCKDCGKVFQEGDLRVKYDFAKQIKVIKWYLEGAGIRSIARMEEVPAPLIVRWIRKFDQIIQQKINENPIPSNKENIAILEVDELVTHCQKKQIKSGFGWLSTGTQMKFWILK